MCSGCETVVVVMLDHHCLILLNKCVNITYHIRLLRTVKAQLYTKVKQSAGLKYIKVNTYFGVLPVDSWPTKCVWCAEVKGECGLGWMCFLTFQANDCTLTVDSIMSKSTIITCRNLYASVFMCS